MAMRIFVSVPVAVEYDGHYVEATLRDISARGARVDHTPFQPVLGTRARILLVLSLAESAYDLEGCIVRVARDGGFAVEFVAVDPRLKAVLCDAGRHVASLPDSQTEA